MAASNTISFEGDDKTSLSILKKIASTHGVDSISPTVTKSEPMQKWGVHRKDSSTGFTIVETVYFNSMETAEEAIRVTTKKPKDEKETNRKNR